ncbi:ROK family protein [candidate division KSB1 bacterium]|nr:ROK family protein [candidate division KSB1 bacterium]RQW08426.1 MAG: ROK family protein [candidate division KSB1 bacterium]
MAYQDDDRIVLTLDAGGTNFVFSAIKGHAVVTGPVRLPSNADHLQRCLDTIVGGFSRLLEKTSYAPVAISFAFPGPADYPNGIIGDLANLPSFRGGIALGPMLEQQFNLPVYINNDGDLFAYGEAIAGFLPWVNEELEKAGSPKRYKNLLGLTFGTGFGAGIVSDGELFLGDNSAAAEIWSMRSKLAPESFVEEGVSIRGVQKAYAARTAARWDELTPKEIFDIAAGERPGDAAAAKAAFAEFGEIAGDAIANASILIDGLVVIGGGLAGASDYFLTALVNEMNAPLNTYDGAAVKRMESRAYNLKDAAERSAFLKGDATMVAIPGSDQTVPYDPLKRIGVGISRLGTSEAISIGAYAFALHALDKKL